MRAVTVELQKWPAKTHRRVDGLLLGEDCYGRWVGVPAGTGVARAGGVVQVEASPYVFVVPIDEWWIGRHFADGGWKLDITTKCAWDGAWATAIDLDLDVRRLRGEVWIEDEDEFNRNLHRGALPMWVAAPARKAAANLSTALRTDREPFATVGDRWLDLLRDRPAH